MKSILVVEDEKEMADILRQVLEESGYKVTLAFHGPEGLNKLRNGEFDLVVLDVMLPGMDGFQVLKSARAEGIITPVLFLTAKDKVQDRVEGLDLGADDYVTKPFQLAELLARVRARVRRSEDTRMVMECEDLTIDIRTPPGAAWNQTSLPILHRVHFSRTSNEERRDARLQGPDTGARLARRPNQGR